MNMVKHIRTNLFGLNQAEFAKEVGVSQTTVSRLETGGIRLSFPVAKSIRAAAKARGIEWDDTLLFEDEAPASATVT